ncbi:MAG TPA: hypothetical protein VKV16_03800 [Solirubrobacteraceae bacterium]|nr:hypothetical protein [Solirubrobacteraceae bacterium]
MRAQGQAGAAAMVAFALLIGAIVGMVAIGEWWSLVVAVLLMIAGVALMARFVQRIGWTRRSGTRLQEGGLQGMHEDLSISDEVHSELSPHDLPRENPAHQEVEHRLRERERAG